MFTYLLFFRRNSGKYKIYVSYSTKSNQYWPSLDFFNVRWSKKNVLFLKYGQKTSNFNIFILDNMFGKIMARDTPSDKKLSKLDKNDKVTVILKFNDPKL